MKTGKPIAIDCGVTLLCDGESVSLHIEDRDANLRFIELTMTPADFTAALGRRAFCPAKAVVRGLECVGRVMEHDELIFQMEDTASYCDKEAACKDANAECPEGWTADLGFNSQDSFFDRNGKQWARTIIRRWVEKEPKP